MIYPKVTRATGVLIYRNFSVYLSNFIFQTFEALVQPLLYLLCFGYLLGSWFDITVVDSYANYVYIGLLFCVPMSISCYESFYSSSSFLLDSEFKKFSLMLPIKSNDIYVSACLWAVLKSIFIMGFFLIIGAAFSIITIFEFLPALLLGTAVALIFSSLNLLFSTYFRWQKNDFNNILYFLIPLFLFSGTFFPTTKLPFVLQEIATYNPLGYAIHLFRNYPLESHLVHYMVYLSLCYLFSFLLLAVCLRLHQQQQRKID